MIQALKWNVFQTIGIQLINFVFSILLARILGPAEFGLVALCMVIITIAQTLMNGGLSESVMRLKNPDDTDYSALFILNFVLSIGLFLVIVLIRNPISVLLGNAELAKLLPIIACLLLINSFSISQSTRLNRKSDFKTQFWINVPATIVSSFIGLGLAWANFGVYALIWMQISFACLASAILWWNSDWKPSLQVSKDKLLLHLKFGLPLTFNALLTALSINLNAFIIGKYFSPSDLGLFNRALAFKNLPINNAANILEKNTFPIIADNSGKIEAQRNFYLKITYGLFSFFIPFVVFLIANGHLIFLTVLGDKWLSAVPFFQLLLIAAPFEVVTRTGINVLKVAAQTRYLVFIETFINALTILAAIVSIYFGLMFLTYSIVFSTILRYILVQIKINSYLAVKFGLNKEFFITAISILVVLSCFGFVFYATTDSIRFFISGLLLFSFYLYMYFPLLKTKVKALIAR